jgi:hypothetical protein
MMDVQHWLRDNITWLVAAVALHVHPPQWSQLVKMVLALAMRRKFTVPDTNTLTKAFHLIVAATEVAEAAIGPGNGEQKKAHAIETLKAQLPTVADDLGIPAPVLQFLLNDQVLGLLIDFAVFAANEADKFAQSAVAAVEAPKP